MFWFRDLAQLLYILKVNFDTFKNNRGRFTT